MSRDMNDPRIAEVIQVFHRHAGSALEDSARTTEQYVTAILIDGYSHEGALSGFPPEGLLALLTTYLQHAPEDEIDGSVAVARAQLAYLLDVEHTSAIERSTGGFYSRDFDYPQRLAKEFEDLAAASKAEQEATVQ